MPAPGATPSASIIIAAHNESAVIARCLDALGPLLDDGLTQVVVACNGCTDDTAAIARRRPGVTVLELDVASKVAALRAGDRVAVAGPRIYLDADVTMSARAARAVLSALRLGTVLAGRPPIHFHTEGSCWAVRRWYFVRSRLPSLHAVLWGAGTYALSESGRARFQDFPDIVSDDLFIDSLFTQSERVIVATDPVVVRTPLRLGDLVKILKRTYRTQTEVGPARSTAISAGQTSQVRDLSDLLRRDPARVGDVALYTAVILTARIAARFTATSATWERDNSSRSVSIP
jgi:hypothetical protein